MLDKLHFFFPDNLHFHERGFASLLIFIKNEKIKTYTNTERLNLMTSFGNYQNKKSFFQKEYDSLKSLDKKSLFNESYKGVNLFEVCNAELLSFLMTKEHWYSRVVTSDKVKLFDEMYKNDKEDLLLNLAVALNWLMFWFELLSKLPLFTHAFVFSGSNIYCRSLLEVLKFRKTKPLVVEHFFTGNNYYCEERYLPIANNSDLRYKTYYESIISQFPKDVWERNRLRMKAINKVLMMKNKNVKQPEISAEDRIILKKSQKKILIIGQVINDYSIIETKLDSRNSMLMYLELIDKLIKQTDYDIIFKAHPWERKKIGKAITADNIFEYKNNLHNENYNRLIIVEDFNLYSLFESVDHVIVLNSQSAIEAAFYGIKPITLAKPFYGNKGFTYDVKKVDDVISYVKRVSKSNLSLDEYNKLEEFLTVALEKHLISVFKSGVLQLKEKFVSPQFIPLYKPIKDSNVDSKNANTVIANQIIEKDRNSKTEEQIVNKINKKKVISKKTKKLISNPKSFFKDSKKKHVRWLHVLFKDKKSKH